MRNNSEWTFGVKELETGELRRGYVKNVVDGDTFDVHFSIYGIQRVRLVGIDTPDIGEEGYEEAKAFVNMNLEKKEEPYVLSLILIGGLLSIIAPDIGVCYVHRKAFMYLLPMVMIGGEVGKTKIEVIK